MKSQQPADDLGDYAPVFRDHGGAESCVTLRIYGTEEIARYDLRQHKASLIEKNIVIRRGRNWYAHPDKLKAFLLDVARARARAALARDRALKPTDKLSAGQKAIKPVGSTANVRSIHKGRSGNAP